ncbi:MAG: hypothetical protein ICV59_06275 [Thermoleophilia bacterium]|nr:hypothetical protein [Thermoleophilia bacterium]
MDEARRVIERLDRIETLHIAGAPATTLLGELRALLGEAEEWLATEADGAAPASEALERCRNALATRESAPTA